MTTLDWPIFGNRQPFLWSNCVVLHFILFFFIFIFLGKWAWFSLNSSERRRRRENEKQNKKIPLQFLRKAFVLFEKGTKNPKIDLISKRKNNEHFEPLSSTIFSGHWFRIALPLLLLPLLLLLPPPPPPPRPRPLFHVSSFFSLKAIFFSL